VTGGVHERGKQNAESGTRFLAAGDFDADLVLEMVFSPKLQVKDLK
jgi:hypothetical protein